MRRFRISIGCVLCAAIVASWSLLVASTQAESASPVHPDDSNTVKDQSIASAGLAEVRISASPEGVRVAATASLHDEQPGSRYVWYLCVFKAQGYKFRTEAEPAWDWIDADHMIVAEPGVPMTPRFSDLVKPDLPPGKYVLELHLSNLPPGMDLADVRGAKHFRNLSSTMVSRKFDMSRRPRRP